MKLKEFIEISNDFFKEKGGNLKNVYHGKRENIEVMEVADEGIIDVFCLEVEFKNSNLFGKSTYLEAYRGYRQMRNDWWDYLQEKGFEQWSKNTKIIGHFIPVLSSDSIKAEPYPVQKSTSYGEILTKYDESVTNNKYYKYIHNEYGLKWLLQDGNKIVIGPDVGLFYGMLAYVKLYGSINNFLDVGTGTGELSAYLIKNNLVKNITASEISEHLKSHITTYLDELNKTNQVSIDYQFIDALKMELPETIDLLSLGIYYGAQPDFFKNHGQKISQRLSENGAVIIQSGMLEGKFNLSSVVGDNEDLYNWEWFNKENTLSEYFTNIESIFVAHEVVTIASNSEDTVKKLKEILINDLDATEIPKLEKIQY